MKRLQLIYNPLAGNHAVETIAQLTTALEQAGWQVVTGHSSPHHRLEFDAAVSHVVVAGGDGTVRHVAAALAAMPHPPGFSVYPMGTINLVAREWGAPRNATAFALHVEADAAKRVLHIAACNDTHFVACASVGPDSQAVALVSEDLKSRIGRMAYAVALARVLWRWQPPKLTINVDGRSFSCEALYLAKGRFFAGPWALAPKASLDQPSFQIVMLKRASRSAFMVFVIAVMLGRAARLANVDVIEGRSIQIESDRPMPVQLDGDDGAALPAMLSLTGCVLRGIEYPLALDGSRRLGTHS